MLRKPLAGGRTRKSIMVKDPSSVRGIAIGGSGASGGNITAFSSPFG